MPAHPGLLPIWELLMGVSWSPAGAPPSGRHGLRRRGGHGCVARVLVMGLWGSAADGGGMQGRAGRQLWALAGLPKLG